MPFLENGTMLWKKALFWDFGKKSAFEQGRRVPEKSEMFYLKRFYI